MAMVSVCDHHLSELPLAWALTSLAPLLNLADEDMNRLKYEFTTMPRRSVIASVLFWGISYVGFMLIAYDTISADFGFGQFYNIVAFIAGLITYSSSGVIYLHSIRQLLLVNRTVKMVKRFNLFQLDPIFAFSTVTSRTGISWVILISATLLTLPGQLAVIPMLIMMVVQVMLAVAAFLLPLRLVNQRLVAEKRRLLNELNQRVEFMLARMNQCLDEGNLGDVHQLNDAVS